MPDHLMNARFQQKIDTTVNWEKVDAIVLKAGEIGIEKKTVGADTAYLMKIGDGTTVWGELPYLQAVAADVYAWAKSQNMIDGVLATYTLDQSKTGAVTATDSLKIALNKIENAIAAAVAGNGEINQNAFSNVKVGSTTIAADSKTDTLEVVAGANITLTPDAANDKLTIAAGHPTIAMGTNTTSTASPAHGGSFDVIDAVSKDANGHVTAVNTKTVTLPADVDTVTKVGYTATAGSVTVSTTPASGTVVLGDAAAKMVAAAIPASPNAAQNAQLPTLQAVKAYADNLLAANDAMVFKGTLGTDGTATALPATHEAGWTYRVVTAGTYAGHVCEVGDLVICVTGGTAADNTHWTSAQTNIDGAVTASATLTNKAVVLGSGAKSVSTLANGTTGQVLKIGTDGPAWSTDNDTKVSNVTNDAGKVFTGLAGNTTLTQTNVGVLKLTGFAQSATPTGAVAATDTLSDALNKLENAIDGKTGNTGTVTSVSITAGSGISVTGSPVTTSGNITVGINNSVTARTSGLYNIAHNAQGLITASAAVTSISADLLVDGANTLVFCAGTASTVV